MPRSPRRRRFKFFPFLALLLGIYLFPHEAIYSKLPLASQQAVETTTSKTTKETYVIKRVIDGDTFLLSNGEKVRLTGIDTPESHNNSKARKDSERSGRDVSAITEQGKEAADFVKKLAEGKEIRMEYDVQKRDKYGRLLVYAYDISTLKNNPQIHLSKGIVVNGDKEIFLNGSIIGSGYAVPMTIPPNVRHVDLFRKLYSEARQERRGLWGP